MKKFLVLMVLVLATLLIIAGCGGGGNDGGSEAQTDATATGETKEFTLDATNYKFDLEEIKVNNGDTVKITLKNTEGLHGVEIDGYDKQIEDGKTVTFVANKTGEFEYRCTIVCGSGHADMKGTLIVQ